MSLISGLYIFYVIKLFLLYGNCYDYDGYDYDYDYYHYS